MNLKQRAYLPKQLAIDGRLFGSPIQQFLRSEHTADFEVTTYSRRRRFAQVLKWESGATTLVVSRALSPPDDIDETLLVSTAALPTCLDDCLSQNARWLKPLATRITYNDLDHCKSVADQAIASWKDRFFFREEERVDGRIIVEGLRSPQIGALHAALAHWQVTNSPSMIVMPTGTGKTETMLALLVCKRLERLLVIVPSSALRDQIAAKFITLGLLRKFGVVGPGALFPVVGKLRHRLHTPDDVAVYFQSCNVIITTMSVISGCSDEVQQKMADVCSHLFIDEAHHISAPTWEKFRRLFGGKPILQFTATPFRSDGKNVGGKQIFNYPLRKAQEEGYFKRINFLPVRAYYQATADEEIARAAVTQLERDRAEPQNLDHLVMARASSIPRAEQVHQIYERIAPQHNPLLIHSEMSDGQKRDALTRLRTGQSRIIVCVDMLGEGFDLPELKIAALHDMHKSLAITLQFTGRFTRTRSNIGDATMIANIGLGQVDDTLQDLYAEDADWNFLLRRMSEGETGRQARSSEFLDGFTDPPTEIPLQNIFPKMSAVVYCTRCINWRPKGVLDAIKDSRLYVKPAINHTHKTLVFVTREREPVAWGNIKDLRDTTWDLYLMHWDSARGLLFINSTNNASVHDELAKAVCGEEVELIRGQRVFRTLAGVNRPILLHLGLKHSLSHAVRFTMHVGFDIRAGLSDAQTLNKIMSNSFTRGYENGEKVSVGNSYKGRVWSYKIAGDISEWVDWCQVVGTKLLDETISFEEILRNFMVPEPITERPALVPLTIEWSEDFLDRNEDTIHIDIGGEIAPFYEVGMELVDPKNKGPLRFRIFTETMSAEYEVQFEAESVAYIPTGPERVEVVVSRRRKTLSEWFQLEPPVIRFENGNFVIYNELFTVKSDRTPFDVERIEVWDWTGIDLKKESQATQKDPRRVRTDSIQYRVIQELLKPGHDPSYDIVYDDDDTDEAADVVAIKIAGERLIVHFFHCKYSKEEQSGARIDDLYVVCGQAQRSVYWKANVIGLLTHLRHREGSRQRKYSVSRFALGDLSKLEEISRRSPHLIPEFKIFVVQPGYSKSKAVASHLDLFAVTELYLQETYAIQFGVITNE